MRPVTLNSHNYRQYFKQKSESDNILLVPTLTIDSRLYKLYYFIQYLDDRFAEKMCDYVQVRALPPLSMPATVAIRNFLALYDITESDYAMETAYKRWQRSLQYQQLRDDEYSLYNRSRIDEQLKRMMCNYVKEKITTSNVSQQQAIRDFLEMHSIRECEYKFATAKKYWLRSRQHKKYKNEQRSKIKSGQSRRA